MTGTGASRRIAVIGLDGTPFSFLQREIGAGNLPNMAGLFARGRFGPMETEIPTVSSAAWASFMTGKNPGEHGIYGFTDRKPGTYELYFPNYSTLKAEPVWERLGRQGKRCCVINVPSTYPARPLNGILVSGFVAPNLQRAVYPAEAYEYLRKAGYRIDVDASLGRESIDALLEDLHLTLDRRQEAFLHFQAQEDWDLFAPVFTGTDRLHHFLWRRYEEGDPTYAPEFVRFYQRLDEKVGELVEALRPGTDLFMLSDHGFCSIKKEIYLNKLLRDRGLLEFTVEDPVTIADIDPSRTKAYCLDPGRVYLNLAGREPGGIVKPEDAGRILDELTGMLLGLKDPDSGEAMVERVARAEELYHGPAAGTAPDLVAVPNRGFDFKGSMRSPGWIGRGHLEGMHTYDDAFFFTTADGHSPPAHIRDVVAFMLEAAGVRE
ncbi:MAG: alkaline phosphatase family protein [Actinobacteria bacterium]|nr:alkaline phosphatase family protein [Actinomycetota bacterium]MCL5883276.1 alkaline phosphatase family protein [Actinomycetota bacterium]